MKLRHLINELNALKLCKGEEFYEKLLEYDFLVRTIQTEDFQIIDETQRIGIYIDSLANEVQFIAYLEKGEKNGIPTIN